MMPLRISPKHLTPVPRLCRGEDKDNFHASRDHVLRFGGLGDPGGDFAASFLRFIKLGDPFLYVPWSNRPVLWGMVIQPSRKEIHIMGI